LRSKLTENPEDLDGWMLLARTLKTTQRFPEALAALETAHQIAPENPRVMVELAEAQIFVSPNGDISEDISALLQRALELDPSQQKALWLLGIAAAQSGDYAFAISYWESLLEQVEPGSAIAQSVQSQINQAKTELGMEVEEVPVVAETEGAWQGIRLTVSADTGAAGMIPTGGVLYVMIRTAGMAMGPPIGVRRIIDPLLPLDITISDADSMLKERQISAETEIQLQARISLTGSPSAKPGDWQSTPMVIAIDSNSPVELVIDQQVE
jgi:cytochrome c-type biogenesis protein CcmH